MGITPLWTTSPPTAWPDAPEDMTVSALNDIEACPRRWALSSAGYPELWNSRGYPPRVYPSALAGTLVHAVLETVTRELVRAGCPSVHDASAVNVLKALGGLSAIIASSTDRFIDRLSANPRIAGQIDQIARTLRAQSAELRVRVQTMLCRRQLPPGLRTPSAVGDGRRTRTPLAFGVYCELELQAPHIKWKGKADLLTYTKSMCELTDFKTGGHSDEHRFQLKAYALLWSCDSELNPSKHLVDRLVLAYPDGDVEIPTPSQPDLDILEQELVERSISARQALAQLPPEARPRADTCQFCGVRHMCDVYWRTDELLTFRREKVFGDLQATVVGRHGATSWDIVIESVSSQPRGILRTNVGIACQPGDRVRILDAAIKLPEPEAADPVVVTMGILSEAYTVSA